MLVESDKNNFNLDLFQFFWELLKKNINEKEYEKESTHKTKSTFL